MNRWNPAPILLLAAALLPVACASSSADAPPAPHERGWVGGTFEAVRGHALGLDAPAITESAIVGMPEGVSQTAGALVVSAPADTPIAVAGVVPGDLVLDVGGTPVESASDVRDAVEARGPGATVPVRIWRGGEVRTADVVVGKETYWRRLSVGLQLALSSRFDLWPFDDGIDLLGLVAFRTHDAGPDLHGVEHDYLRAAVPGRPVAEPAGRGFDMALVILTFGVRDGVETQEAAAAR
jgi:hypothetical protein